MSEAHSKDENTIQSYRTANYIGQREMESVYKVHTEACNESSREACKDKKNKLYPKFQQLEEEEIAEKGI